MPPKHSFGKGEVESSILSRSTSPPLNPSSMPSFAWASARLAQEPVVVAISGALIQPQRALTLGSMIPSFSAITSLARRPLLTARWADQTARGPNCQACSSWTLRAHAFSSTSTRAANRELPAPTFWQLAGSRQRPGTAGSIGVFGGRLCPTVAQVFCKSHLVVFASALRTEPIVNHAKQQIEELQALQ